jgi:pimeloyl-ACP methyl ester carboxylesterase
VWENEAKLLAPNYRLHLVQVDGFAGAPAGPNASGPMLAPIVEELHAYIVATGMHPAVMGHSLGGLLTLMLADKHPEDVRKIIIVDTLPYYAVLFSPGATVDMMKPQAEAIRQQVVGLSADQLTAMTTMSATMMAKDPDGQKHVAEFEQATDRVVMANAMVEDLLTDMRGEMASIKTPALLLFAVDASAKQPDPVVYEATMREGYKPMPNVTVVKVEDSRHFIMYDQPAKFDAAVESFLK